MVAGASRSPPGLRRRSCARLRCASDPSWGRSLALGETGAFAVVARAFPEKLAAHLGLERCATDIPNRLRGIPLGHVARQHFAVLLHVLLKGWAGNEQVPRDAVGC